MKHTTFHSFLKIIIPLTLTTLLYPQRLDPPSSTFDELRTIVETASRSQQRIWVEDFTGLN